jgi:hypothetical protein
VAQKAVSPIAIVLELISVLKLKMVTNTVPKKPMKRLAPLILVLKVVVVPHQGQNCSLVVKKVAVIPMTVKKVLSVFLLQKQTLLATLLNTVPMTDI